MRRRRHVTSGVADLTLNQLMATPFGGELIAAGSTIDPRPAGARCSSTSRTAATSAHRAIMARWAGLRGVPASAEEIVVAAGAQHGLLAALATLTRPGDAVLTEAVTYTGVDLARQPPRTCGWCLSRWTPAASTSTPSPAAAKRTGARVAYLMPTLQNPTGVTLSAARRKALLQAAARHDVTLIEDDEYGVFSSTLPLAADAPDRCVYLTGVSKAVAPGLRVGLLRAPAALVPRLGAAVFASTRDGAAVRDRAGRALARPTGWPSASSPGSAASSRPAPRWRARSSGCAICPRLSAARVAADGAARRGGVQEQARLRGVLVSAGQSFAVGQTAPPAFVRVCLGPPATREALGRALEVLRDVARPAADAARGDGVISARTARRPRRRPRRDRRRSADRSSTRRPDPRW